MNAQSMRCAPWHFMKRIGSFANSPGTRTSIWSPSVARNSIAPVFVEGWALYADNWVMRWGPRPAALCTPTIVWSAFLRNVAALRLVVDMGFFKRWSREKAVEFMLANSSMSSHNAQAEVDRYVWPGQALASNWRVNHKSTACEASLRGFA